MKEEVRRKSVEEKSEVAVARRATGSEDARATKTVRKAKARPQKKSPVARATCCPGAETETSVEPQEANARGDASGRSATASRPGQQVARATKAEGTAKRTASEAMLAYWEKVRAGEVPDPRGKERPARKSVNPLFDLGEEARAKLFTWLRECPYDDAILHMLRDQGLDGITRAQLDDFFQFEAEQHWEKRITRAAQEANALVRLVEKSPAKYSAGILAALGQEVFRQIASGDVEPDAMGKLATLFLKARGDERADQMQELKREKLKHELEDQVEHALEKLAEEVDRHPAAKEAFDALKRELADNKESAS